MLPMETRAELSHALQTGAIVVTPNNRLSNQLLYDYSKKHPALAQEKPRCLPYQAFLRSLFQDLCHRDAHTEHPVVLTPLQKSHLFRQILSTDTSLSCQDGLLSEVEEAFTSCQHWLVDTHNSAFEDTTQWIQFREWLHQFQQQLHTMNAITEEQLAPYLIAQGGSFCIASIVWCCFDDYTPQQRALQQALASEGCRQYHYDIPEESPTVSYRFTAADEQDEYLHMISWLKHRLAAGDERIGIVVPELQTHSQRLKRFLQRHLPDLPFNLSLGKALNDYPLIAHALTWLSLDGQPLSNLTARLILHSPFLAGARTESSMRAQTMQDSRLLQEELIPFEPFQKALKETTPRLGLLLEQLSNYPVEASPNAWATHFKARLTALGFPGEYPLNSESYQCFQRLVMLFDELQELALISPLMRKKEALEALQRLAKSSIFQVKQPRTSIQVLGLLEASGCTFDSVWFCGLTDQCLPQRVKLSAFIPLSLQRDLKMPHAVASRELQFAKQFIERLQRGSREIIFSYPKLSGDLPELPSPFIAHLAEWAQTKLIPTADQTSLVSFEDTYLLPFTDNEAVSGGTALLANQAKCPFRAFAAHRLHAKSSLDISEGPSHIERGQITHRIMDLLWQRLGSQENLYNTSPEMLHQTIEEAIHQALEPITCLRKHSFPLLVQEVEHARLKRLVHECLLWEKERPPFIVEALEQEFTLTLGGIDFRIRVDRLDKTMSNTKWVIDYKSTLPVSNPWYEERPNEPQLLLYALLDQNINALLFVQLKAGRIVCSGLSEETTTLKGMQHLKKDETWPSLQQEWHRELTKLAEEFRNGPCLPKPARESACQRCDFPTLCRIGLR